MSKQYQNDEKFKGIEPSDVNIEDTVKASGEGIKNFWLQAMLNHPNISKLIEEHDKKILTLLRDVKISLHKDYGYGFDVAMYF